LKCEKVDILYERKKQGQTLKCEKVDILYEGNNISIWQDHIDCKGKGTYIILQVEATIGKEYTSANMITKSS